MNRNGVMEKEKKQKTYRQYILFKWSVLLILAAALLAAAVFAVHAGSSGISVWEVLKTLFGAGTKQTGSIVFGIRLCDNHICNISTHTIAFEISGRIRL